MSNFINDVINADAILDEIDDYIEKGMTQIQIVVYLNILV